IWLAELLPVALLPPVVAAARPSLETVADWLLPPVPEPKGLKGVKVGVPEPDVAWLTPVCDSLPDALAAPELMVAVPVEVLVGEPRPTLASTRPPVVAPGPPMVLAELLPVAVLPPVLATPLPLLPTLTLASWPMARGARATLNSAKPETRASEPATVRLRPWLPNRWTCLITQSPRSTGWPQSDLRESTEASLSPGGQP